MLDSLDAVEKALRAIARSQGPTITLAELGSRLRAHDPRFSLEALGFATLTELLRACASVGTLRFGARPQDRWFDFAAGLGDTQAQVVLRRRITERVWMACVDYEGGRQAWVDLADPARIETNPEAVATEPERFLPLPQFGRARQLDLLEAWAYGQTMEIEVRTMTENHRHCAAGLSSLRAQLRKLGVWRSWSSYLQAQVEQDLLDWSRRHGIDSAAWFDRATSTPGFEARRSAHQARPTPRRGPIALAEPELRLFLKAIIDDMTAAELGQVPVPARFLFARDEDE